MRHVLVFFTACSIAACSTVTSQVDTFTTELTFIVPETVRTTEPAASRVSLLLGSGRIATYERDAVLRRRGHQLVIDDGPGTRVRGEHDIVDVRAVQLERRAFVVASSDAQQAAKRGKSPVGWILGTIATVGLLAVIALD